VIPDTFPSGPSWPYLGTLIRLALAIGLGLFVGLERERRGKEAGVRTFAFAATAGCVGGLLGDPYCYIILGLLTPFVVFLNLHSLQKDSDTEMTTSIALLLTILVGILCGKGHTFTPVAVGLATAGLLAWKQLLAGFSTGITENELRSAILLGVIAFVIFPVLPPRAVDPWELIDPRTVWITVILIAAIGFGNYVLLKSFGSRGVSIAGFLAGLVNSTVAVTELADRTRTDPSLAEAAFRGTMLATSAMLLRNAVLLAILSPTVLFTAGLPIAAMFTVSTTWALVSRNHRTGEASPPTFNLDSPFSLLQALKFGFIFLLLSIFGTLSIRGLGSTGFYTVSAIGGLVSSASSVASAGQLSAHHQLSDMSAGIGAVFATVTSAAVGIPIVFRVSRNGLLSRRVCIAIAVVAFVGIGCATVARSAALWLHASMLPSSRSRP